MGIDELLKKHQIVEGTFDTLDCFDFSGVYIIYDGDSNEVVYVGSSYTRNISERLRQYINSKDTGNTLMYAICKEDYRVPKVKDITECQKKKAVNTIKKFKIKAIPYQDLEYQLIDQAKPKYNTAGNTIDTLEE